MNNKESFLGLFEPNDRVLRLLYNTSCVHGRAAEWSSLQKSGRVLSLRVIFSVGHVGGNTKQDPSLASKH